MTEQAITLVVAMARNRVIGADGRMPWHLPGELKRFRRMTTGHPIVMGRRTHESIGRPLPERHNIVLSRDPAFAPAGLTVARSMAEALEAAGPGEVMVIGGEAVFEAFLPSASAIERTVLEADIAGDTYFPKLGRAWQVVKEETGEEGGYRLRFERLERPTDELST